MKIGMQTWGSNGDIRPMLALADGLQRAGHEVTLVVSSIDNKDYHGICEKLNIRYQKVPERIKFDLPAFAHRTFRMNTLQWLQALLDEAFFPYEPIIYQKAKQLVKENNCVIGHHFLYPLKLAAIKRNIPHISVTFCHVTLESVSIPPFRFPNMGKKFNWLGWRLMHFIFDWVLKKRLGTLWRNEGMAEFKHVLPGLLSSNLLNLVAVDPSFCAHQDEWEPVNKACGFLNLLESSEPWEINDSLDKFLEAGSKPIYMTLGSLQQAVPDWSMKLFVQAAELVGCRAIIQTSSDEYPAGTQYNDIYFIGRHPHQPLFKKCAAIVHHGGAGTTQSATISGCPSVVVPFMDEQLFWACQLEKMGLAGKPLSAKKATAENLAKHISVVLSSGEMARNAQLISRKLHACDGVANAVALINELSANQR